MCDAMEDLNNNSVDPTAGKSPKKIKIEHPGCERTVSGRKTLLSKKPNKIYKVIVTYIPVTDEEARIKRSIIESILKKDHKK